MDELKLKTFVVGSLANNAYLVFSEKTKDAFLIDAPYPSTKIKRFIQKKGLSLEFITLTHAHYDHVGSLEDFDQTFYVHKEDEFLLTDSKLNGSAFFSTPLLIDKPHQFYDSKVKLSFEGSKIDVIHTPGHTPGGVCLKIGNWLFTGDTLFYRSVGRTDMPYASSEKLISSIEKKLFVLDEQTIVYPGHGPESTIGQEKAENPFLLNTSW